MIQIPVDLYKDIPFQSIEKWIEDHLLIIREFILENKQMEPLIFYIFEKDNMVNEKIVHLKYVINDSYSKDIVSEIVPQKLKEDNAFACVSCFEAWLRNTKNFEIMDEILIINCEIKKDGMTNQNVYMFKIIKENDDIILEKFEGDILPSVGRFSQFLLKEPPKNPTHVGIELEAPLISTNQHKNKYSN